jgi:hypothetical protein
MSSPQSVDTKKKSFTNYRVFGFWLANHLKEEGVIDVDMHKALLDAQQIFGAKDAQEEFYGKFFTSLPEVTKDLKEHVKSSAQSSKAATKLAEKEAAKAAKLVEKEAAKEAAKAEKAEKLAAKLAEKEAAKAEKLAAKLAEKEAAKAEKLAAKLAAKKAAKVEKAEKLVEKDAAKAEKVVEEVVENEEDERPGTPLLVEEEYEEVEESSSVKTDPIMKGLLEEVLSEADAESLVLEVNDLKKKKTLYIKRPIQINNVCFLDAEMKQSANALCVMSEGKEDSDPVFQYKRGKQIK